MHPDHSPTYDLSNFQTVLDFVAERYADVLTPGEQGFIARFSELPPDAQALLVRLIMRSRDIYAVDALHYDEFTDMPAALDILQAADFVDQDARISLDELFSVATKPELLAGLAEEGLSARLSKPDMRFALDHHFEQRRTLSDWLNVSSRRALRINVRTLADTYRLLFFGNLYQDWSEFVITDLGHLSSEHIPIDEMARGFQCRADVDVCLQLHQLRIRLDAGEQVASVYPCLPDVSPLVSAVVSSRIHKLMFQLGQEAERGKDWLLAKTIYKDCHDKRARYRLMRVHEQLSDWSAAYAIALAI